MADIEDFFRELDDFAKQVTEGNNAEEWAMELGERVLTDLVEGTPFDTGRARSSYAVSKDAPVYVEASDVTRKDRVTEDEALDRAKRTLQNLRGFQIGQTIYISNGASYIDLLENGRGSRGPNANLHLMFALTLAKYSEGEPDLRIEVIR